MNKKYGLGLLVTAALFGTLGYAGGNIVQSKEAQAQIPVIATQAYVRAVCGTDVAGCQGIVRQLASSGGHREFTILNGMVYSYVEPGGTLYPADTQPTVLGRPCTGFASSEYDLDGDCTFEPRATASNGRLITR